MLKNSRLGFSVVELVVAIAIFAIIVPAMAVGVRNLILINSRARNLAVASIIAEAKAEELRGLGFNALPLGTTDITSELPTQLSSPNQASYEITNPSPGIAEIVINITYEDFGKDKNLTYKTTVSELGVGQ